MIRKSGELSVTSVENMRGGSGSVTFEHFLSKDEFFGKGRLFSRIILNPGCSIGRHVHENETEVFVVLKGTADYDDNGTMAKIEAGDVTITHSGQGHAVANSTNEPVELLALIIFE